MEEFSINVVAQLVEQWTGNQRVTGSSITAGGVTMLHPFFLVILARSNFDHYTMECEFGILKKKQNKKNLSAVFLTK